MNETDAANKNFDVFINAMATENPKTKDPDSIMLVVQEKKIKFIHSCKKKAAPTPIQPPSLLASSAKKQEPSLLSLTRLKQQLQRK